MSAYRATETLVCLLVITVAALTISEASALPPGSFDPLGSGAVPMLTAALVLVLAMAIVLRGILLGDGSREPADPASERGAPTIWPAAWFLVLTIVYLLVLDQRILHFVPVTMGFLLLSLVVLNGGIRSRLAWTLGISIGFPVFIFICFTRIFVVDIPGAF